MITGTLLRVEVLSQERSALSAQIATIRPNNDNNNNKLKLVTDVMIVL